jgi:hypothetical protein
VIFDTMVRNEPISVAALSKAWVCGSSLAAIVGSNFAKVMGMRLL